MRTPWFRALALALLTTLLVLPASPGFGSAGPSLIAPSLIEGSLTCYGNLATSPGLPVLLVHGTGVTAKENWGPTYLPDLQKAGHSVCTVELPNYGFDDVQKSVGVVVNAIRTMHRLAHRKISAIGHSQGGFQLYYAVRLWPDLAADLDDIIGLSGVYDNGSQQVGSDCTSKGCSQAFWQFSPGSHLLTALKHWTLPKGPSYSVIGTLADSVVTPQPYANQMAGARSIEIQQICPGRQYVHGYDHDLMAGDAVAHALVIDALTHPGPADSARINRSVCGELFFAGVDLVQFLANLPAMATRQPPVTHSEPALSCFMQLNCGSVRLRGVLLAWSRITVIGDRIQVTVHMQGPGALMVKSAGCSASRRVGLQTYVMTLRCQPGRHRLTILTKPDPYLRWLVERDVAITNP